MTGRPILAAVLAAFLALHFTAGCDGTGTGKSEPPPPVRYRDPSLSSEEHREIVEALANLVATPENIYDRIEGEVTLIKRGKIAIPYVRPLLKSKRHGARYSAARIMFAVGGDEIVPDLIDLLHDSNQLLKHDAGVLLVRKVGSKFGLLDSRDEEEWEEAAGHWRTWYLEEGYRKYPRQGRGREWQMSNGK